MARPEAAVEKLALEVGANLALEVDDVEVLGQGGRSLVRITIDKPGGVTLDDCEALSRDLEALLDVDNPIKGRYTLEVSSPGLDRVLKRPRHYEKNAGKPVRVVLKDAAGTGAKGLLTGLIKSADESGFVLESEGVEQRIAYADVKKAKLEVQI